MYLVETIAPVIEAPIDDAAVRDWLRRVPGLRLDGHPATPATLTARLASFWLRDTPVLFVGAAPRSIAGRIAAQLATPLGSARPFAGGHWLRTLRGSSNWRLWWARTDAVEEYTDALLDAFVPTVSNGAVVNLPEGAPVLPFGNLETGTGVRRSHGITGSLMETPATPVAPARSTRARPAAQRAQRATRPRTTRVAPSAPAEATHLSPEGLARLEAELLELRSTGRPEVIARVAAARALGDLRENADYEAARNEQSFLEGRIRSLEALIASAVIIKASGTPEVRLGSTVVVESDGAERTFELVGSTEADPVKGRISDRSPVGQALMGRRAGDEVVVRLPVSEARYRIIEVR